MAPPRKTVAQYEREAKRVGKCLVHPSCGVARKVYQLRHGELPTKLYVCHTCDNPMCILDKHHFIGTCGDNVRDAVAKGRHSCFRKGGVRNTTKHTPEAKAKIAEASRKMWASLTTEQRAARSAERWKNTSAHARRVIALKAWETRRESTSSNLR